MRCAICLVAIVLSTAACSAPAPPQVRPPRSDPGPAPAPAPPGTAPAPDLVGAWSSASCAERGYERRIELRPDGTFSAEDLVSPCPPGARCMWSGIVSCRGRWKNERVAIALTAEPVPGPAPGIAFP